MNSEWVARWAVLQERLAELARSCGGQAERHSDELLLLHAPARGSCMRVWLHGEGVAEVSTDALVLSATWALTDDEPEDLEDIVRSIMDGRATITSAYTFTLEFEGGGTFHGGTSAPQTIRLQGWQAEPWPIG